MRVALVTGGGRGIGRAIALVLARDGHAVAVGDLDAQLAGQTVTAVEAADGRGLTLALDVTDSASVAAAVARTADELGAVDIWSTTRARMSCGRSSKRTRPFGTA